MCYEIYNYFFMKCTIYVFIKKELYINVMKLDIKLVQLASLFFFLFYILKEALKKIRNYVIIHGFINVN